MAASLQSAEEKGLMAGERPARKGNEEGAGREGKRGKVGGRHKGEGGGRKGRLGRRGDAAAADTDDRFVRERTDHSTVALIIIIRILMAVERPSLKPAPETAAPLESPYTLSLSLSLSFSFKRLREGKRWKGGMPPRAFKNIGDFRYQMHHRAAPLNQPRGRETRSRRSSSARSSRRAPPAEPFNHEPMISLSLRNASPS